MWEPLMSRMYLVSLTESFLGTSEFPYSTQDLAGAIKQVLNEQNE